MRALIINPINASIISIPLYIPNDLIGVAPFAGDLNFLVERSRCAAKFQYLMDKR